MRNHCFRKLTAAICTIAMLLSLAPAALAANTFSDVPPSQWAYQSITEAENKGIAAGYADGTFHPEGEVTYAQFAAFLARAFYKSPVSSASSPWYQTYIDAMSGDGILIGTAASGQNPSMDKPITRYDMAMMMYHIMAFFGGLPSESEQQKAGTLTDWRSMPEQYMEAVAACFGAGILSGMPDGSFSGSQAMNRAQACTVIARTSDYIGKTSKNPAPPSYPLDAKSAEAVGLINAERAKRNLPSLGTLNSLNNAAAIRLDEVMGKTPDTGDCMDALDKSGALILAAGGGELVVPKEKTAADAVKALMGEAEVAAAVLDADAGLTHVGAAVTESGGQTYWMFLFIESLDGSAAPSAPAQPSQPAGQPASSNSNQSVSGLCAEVLRLINAERTKAGLKTLDTLDSLTKAAQMRSDDLSKGHFEDRPDGSDWSSVFETAGVTSAVNIDFVDESIVGGVNTAAQVMEQLKTTPEALDALTTKEYTHVGVGYTHTANGYGGYQDFWSILYIQPVSAPAAGSGASFLPEPDTSGSSSASFTPVPVDQLANKSSLQKKLTDSQMAQAYAEAVKLVTPYAGLSLEQQLQGVASALRKRFESGMNYSMTSANYNNPYGFFIEGSSSCAGCTRATGLCLNILGIPYEHVNENQYDHQWCRVNVNGTYWICDAFGLYCGPEPAPYAHPYF